LAPLPVSCFFCGPSLFCILTKFRAEAEERPVSESEAHQAEGAA